MDASEWLRIAIYNNDLKLLTSILNGDYGNFDMNARDLYGQNCFHLAAICGFYEVMCELLQRDLSFINESSCYNDGASALLLAVMRGNDKVVELLLDRGANICHRDSLGRTALHLAAKKPFLTMVQILLKHGARVNDLDNSLNNALLSNLTSDYGDDKVVECLLKNGSSVNHENQRHEHALSIAISKGLTSIVKLLIAYGADTNIITPFSSPKLTLLQFVAYKVPPYHDTADVIDALVLEGNLDINGTGIIGETPFAISSNVSNDHAARRLLDFHCDINVRDKEVIEKRVKEVYESYFDRFLREHCVKLRALNCWVSSRYDKYFGAELSLTGKFGRKCVAEAELLKTIKVKGGGRGYNSVSCYDILVSSLEHATTRLRNFDLTSICHADFIEVPEYREMILCRLRLIQKRLALIAVSENNLNNRVYVLPQICVDKVVHYLTNNDLHRMNNALAEVGQNESENDDTEIQHKAIEEVNQAESEFNEIGNELQQKEDKVELI